MIFDSDKRENKAREQFNFLKIKSNLNANVQHHILGSSSTHLRKIENDFASKIFKQT